MNENKRIDNPQIKIGKCLAHSRIKQALNHHKINNGHNCHYYKFLVINLGLTKKNRPVANLPDVDFCSQSREMPSPESLNTLLSVFLFVFWFVSDRNLSVL